MNSLSAFKIDQLPDVAVELIVEFVGNPFSVMVLSVSTSALVTALFRERTRATKVQQLGCILKPVVRELMEAQRDSVFQRPVRWANNHLHRLSPRFFEQAPTYPQIEHVVRAMGTGRFDLPLLKISMGAISGGLECLRQGRGDFFDKVLMKSIAAYGEYFPRKHPDDPDRIEEWITGLGTSIRLREEMQLEGRELEQFSSIFGERSLSTLSLMRVMSGRRDQVLEMMEYWRIRLTRLGDGITRPLDDPMADSVLREVRIRDCYVISSVIRSIGRLSDSSRKIALMVRLEAECIQHLPDLLGITQHQWFLHTVRCLKKIRDLSDQEREGERSALDSATVERAFFFGVRLGFWTRMTCQVTWVFAVISFVRLFTTLVRLLWLGKQGPQIWRYCLWCACNLSFIWPYHSRRYWDVWFNVGLCLCGFVLPL